MAPTVSPWTFPGIYSSRTPTTTVAGNGTPNCPSNICFSGDGGLAAAAQLHNPTGVAVDASGNLFIVDDFNSRIRKVSVGGVITTVAGNGNIGFSGDGGPATTAALNNPAAVAVDASGNLFIADSGNNRIRKVSASGVITTFAGNGVVKYNQYESPIPVFSGDGGPATSASLTDPSGIAVDASGNLFIADAGNQRIRKVSTTGIIMTVAGNPANGAGDSYSGDGGLATAAYFASPTHVAVDALGNLFISDSDVIGSNRVLFVSASSGIITTVAGNGTGLCGSNNCFSGDGGPATSATLDSPEGIALDASGNLFIADSGNNRIRKVSLVGAPTAQFRQPIQPGAGVFDLRH
jgi:sugar lactone lactonase YvrE